VTDRRNFIKTTLTVASGMALGQASTVLAATSESCPAGIIYTAENAGQWSKKVKGHIPQVKIEGKTVTLTTEHGMSEEHYIVRHTLVSGDGKVLGAKTFSPSEEDAVSTYELPDGQVSKLYATSFCNKHDLWVTEVTL
jgi:superoxide reductase